MKPYYEQDGITIYHGDNREVLRTLDVEVDLVFTSPPYNVGISPSGPPAKGAFYTPSRGGRSATKWAGFNGYGTHADAMPMEEYEAWQQDVLVALVERGHIAHEGMDAEGNHALRQAVCGLRKKLDPSMRIVTVRGEGYWLEKTG